MSSAGTSSELMRAEIRKTKALTRRFFPAVFPCVDSTNP